MSDNGVIKESNGYCITADSNFASKGTCEQFYANLLNEAKKTPGLADFFSAEDSSSYETITLPLGLRNLSQVDQSLTSHRENYGNERAELESRLYAADFYPPNDPEHAAFYSSFMPGMIDDVKGKFSGTSGGNPISVVSQISFSRLSRTLVNLLLMKKPDGTDNIVRRRKAKPNSEIINEDGSISYEYYTSDEIAEGEKKLYDEKNAQNYRFIDVGYVPFTYDYLLLSAASLISAKRTERNSEIELPSVDDIFVEDEDNDPVLNEQLRELATIANRDLTLIDIIESRNASIFDIIHADCRGDQPSQQNKSSSLTLREIYINLLMYIRVIIFIAVDLIKIVREYGVQSTTSNKIINVILGIELVNETNKGYMATLEELLNSEEISEMLESMPLMFRFNEHFFRILLVNLVRRATIGSGVKTEAIVEKFATHIGYTKPDAPIGILIRNLFSKMELSVPESSIIDNKSLINTVLGRKEPIVSYIYRTAEKYLDMETGRFKVEPAIIDSTLKSIEASVSGKKSTQKYNILESDFVFSLDGLIDTIKRLSGVDSLNEDSPIFKTYKRELDEKTIKLNDLRKQISEDLDKIYGQSFSRFYINLPPIPYDTNERKWAARKCLEIEANINIITQINQAFNWIEFRDALRNLEFQSERLANSDVENPAIINDVSIAQKNFDNLCMTCGLDDSNLSKLKNLEKSLLYYSNLDKIKFGFTKFDFKFDKGVDQFMRYQIGKTYIIHQGSLKSVQSLLPNPDFNQIMYEYFRPFFEPFATTNVQAFDLTFEVQQRQVANKNKEITRDNVGQLVSDVIMTVKFGCTDDTHICSKFRTRFYCIKDTKILFLEAKKKLGIPIEKTDFSYNEVPIEFMIKWDRTKEQNTALAGSLGEKTYKLYDVARGCDEKYPFYDSSGMNIVRKAFEMASERYRRFKDRPINLPGKHKFKVGDNVEVTSYNRRNVWIPAKIIVVGETGLYDVEYEDKYVNSGKVDRKVENRVIERRLRQVFSDGPVLGSMTDEAIKEKEKARDFWSAINLNGENVNIATAIEDVTNQSSSTEKQKSKSVFDRKQKYQGGNHIQHSNVNENGGLVIIDHQPSEISQIFTHRRSRKPVFSKDGEWMNISYNRKTIQGYKLPNNSPTTNQQNSQDARQRKNATPSRFAKGLSGNSDQQGQRHFSRYRGRDRGQSRERQPRHNSQNRRGTPNSYLGGNSIGSGYKGFTPGSKSTPVSMNDVNSRNATPSSRGDTPLSQNRMFSSSSPSANKRSGFQGGYRSPNGSISPHYLEPNHNDSSIFNNLPTNVGSLGFFPSASPMVRPNESDEIFIQPPTGVFPQTVQQQEVFNIAPPTGVFENRRDNTDNSDKPHIFETNEDDYDF